MRRYLERHWYRDEPPPRWLQPLSRLYASVAERRAQRQRAVAQRLPVPVVVVGNVAVGGTGKTPCVLWIVAALQAMGRHPGILSRGYGGRGPFPLTVDAQTAPVICGDEPSLLARRARVPLACAPDRVAAGRHLLAAHPEVDVLVCDDGLQHYRLARDLEFCVVDAARGFGNGWRLPAGPLREPRTRAEACALLLVNGCAAAAYGLNSACFDLVADGVRRVGGAEQRSFADFAAHEVCAVAGIGRPQRFFNLLRQRGLTVHGRAFADH
ncbi:MAG TPA: tetraacyldisaccharide 4'-kinase, partial [Nevskiaceae bacterium]|nr:tetraacyldisaccharide 4'-kinase [Nevskiaceae bacterium]